MAKLLDGLTAVGGAAAAVVLLIAGNGGYVWREDCTTSTGRVETAWSYRIHQIIPYLAPSQPGCEYYSGTRAIASAVGVWKIPRVEAARREDASSASPQTKSFVDGASQVLASISGRWDRTVRLGEEIRGMPPSEALALVRREFDGISAAYNRHIERLETLPVTSDDELEQLRRSLVEWLRLQQSANEIVLSGIESGSTQETIEAQVRELASDMATSRASLLRLRATLPPRYPSLREWAFLERT